MNNNNNIKKKAGTQHKSMCVYRKYHLEYQIKQTKGYYTKQKIKKNKNKKVNITR